MWCSYLALIAFNMYPEVKTYRMENEGRSRNRRWLSTECCSHYPHRRKRLLTRRILQIQRHRQIAGVAFVSIWAWLFGSAWLSGGHNDCSTSALYADHHPVYAFQVAASIGSSHKPATINTSSTGCNNAVQLATRDHRASHRRLHVRLLLFKQPSD